MRNILRRFYVFDKSTPDISHKIKENNRFKKNGCNLEKINDHLFDTLIGEKFSSAPCTVWVR